MTTENTEAMRAALELASNRLHRAALDAPFNSRQRYELDEWAAEARAALSQAEQRCPLCKKPAALLFGHQANGEELEIIHCGCRLSQAEQQVIQRLVDESGVMPVVMCVAGDLQDDVPVVTEDRVRKATASLQAKLEDAEREIDGLKDQIDEQNTWPDWANQILKMVRERSGNDGYFDMSEGVDLPDEVDDALSELAAQAERAKEKLRQSEARVRELEKDAARYRFLRDADRSEENCPYEQMLMYAMESLDEAIDAAMKKEGGV